MNGWGRNIRYSMRIARLIAAMAAVMVICGGLTQSSAEGVEAWVNVQEDSCLCVRSKPEKGATVKYRLPRNTGVEIVEEKSGGSSAGWCYILCGEDGGWCWGAYLSDDRLPEESVASVYRVHANGRVAVRDAPGGKRVGWVHDGDTVTVTGTRTAEDGTSWVVTAEGYIQMDYVREADDD